jgi:23S rRNA A2030 N6-methylase RlmJ
MTSETPNQDKNAGNRGDVWKHRTLLALTNLLLDRHPSGRPFRYFESHAGKGVYRLSDSKGARDGIHAASERLADTDPYMLAEAAALESGVYLGSWKLISDLLHARRMVGRLQLCDADAEVLAAARPNANSHHEFVFHQGDGFDAAREANADIYLIDPFASWPESAKLATEPKFADKNLLVWYGIVANGKPNKLVHTTGLLGFEVLWSQVHPNHSPTQRGCGLLLSRPLQVLLPQIIRDSLEAAVRLGWQLHFRVPWEVAQPFVAPGAPVTMARFAG